MSKNVIFEHFACTSNGAKSIETDDVFTILLTDTVYSDLQRVTKVFPTEHSRELTKLIE
jgi:hypothetical protein